MSNIVLQSLAELCVKGIGTAGVEAIAMAMVIKSVWAPLAEDFYEELHTRAIDLQTGTVDHTKALEVHDKHRERMTVGFISQVENVVGDYSEMAYEQGMRSAAPKATKDYMSDLVRITHAKRKNVSRTINRWFTATQGLYFERFIDPYLPYYEERLLELGLEVGTLNKIGRDYKKFVAAEGYWDSVTDFNSHSAVIWGAVDAIHEQNFLYYRIVAQMDRNTCPVCVFYDGTTWSVADARRQLGDMLLMTAEESAAAFPWPREKDLPESHSKIDEAPFGLPPFHLRCRCDVETWRQ